MTRPFDGHALGDVLAPDDLAEGQAVMLDGRVVGTAFVPRDAAVTLTDFPASSPEARFIASSTLALVVALGLALAVALAVGVWLAGRTVRPLRQLTGAARALAAGDLGRTVPVERTDEVGALADAFNAMSARLAQATALRHQMTADVSHDLRTPVTTVLGTLELIESGALEATPQRIGAARAQAQRLARLVESFHTLALADAGELPVHPTRVDPADALRQSAAAFEARAETVGVEIAVEAHAPALSADPDRLAQMLDNLVTNALRHTPAGGRVTLSGPCDDRRRRDRGFGHWQRDSGRGAAHRLRAVGPGRRVALGQRRWVRAEHRPLAGARDGRGRRGRERARFRNDRVGHAARVAGAVTLPTQGLHRVWTSSPEPRGTKPHPPPCTLFSVGSSRPSS